MKNISYTAHKSGKEQGFTLIEAMVSLTIGLFIVLLVSVIYTASLQTLKFRQGQSENLGNSRYTLDTLGLEFAKAGYRRDPTKDLFEAFPADATAENGCQFSAGQSIYVDATGALCIRYHLRDAQELNCVGQGGNIADVKPYKQAEDLSDRKGMFVEKYFIDGDRLRCQAGTEVVDLADGIRGIHFAFGVGKFSADRNKERKIDAFVTTLPSTKKAIRALRYSVLLVSSQPNVTGGVESSICTRWTKATGNQTACSANDGRLYQIASKALTLRNQMP